MTKRRIGAFALAVGLFLAPVAGAHVPGTNYSTPGHEAALAVLASLSSVVYFPVKVGMATVGLVTGGVVGVLTGGDVRAAYAVWVPLAGGDYLVRPAHLDGLQPFEALGTRYDDEPSRYDTDGSMIYDAMYGRDVPAPRTPDEEPRSDY